MLTAMQTGLSRRLTQQLSSQGPANVIKQDVSVVKQSKPGQGANPATVVRQASEEASKRSQGGRSQGSQLS